MYDRSGASQRGGQAGEENDEDNDEAQSELTRHTNDAIEERTDALMSRVSAILARAEARGASSGEELSEVEERELREVVGQSLFQQIREGWGAADEQAQSETQGQDRNDTQTAATVAPKETEEEAQIPTEEQHGPCPDR